MKPSGYASDHHAALIALGALISLAMFLWDRRPK